MPCTSSTFRSPTISITDSKIDHPDTSKATVTYDRYMTVTEVIPLQVLHPPPGLRSGQPDLGGGTCTPSNRTRLLGQADWTWRLPYKVVTLLFGRGVEAGRRGSTFCPARNLLSNEVCVLLGSRSLRASGPSPCGLQSTNINSPAASSRR